MTWERKNDTTLILTAYDGAHEVAELSQDDDGDYTLHSAALSLDELLGAQTIKDAKREALDLLEGALEGEVSYFNELIASIKDLRKDVTP